MTLCFTMAVILGRACRRQN